MARAHLLSSRKMYQDGTWVVNEMSRHEFKQYFDYHLKHDEVINHITKRTSDKLGLYALPPYKRVGKFENMDRLLIAESGKYYRGTYFNKCSN